MSEKRTIETELTDLKLIEEVIKERSDLSIMYNIKPQLLFTSTDKICNVVVRNNQNGYQVGFLKEKDKITIIFDDWQDTAQTTIISKIVVGYKERIIRKRLTRFKVYKKEETEKAVILTLRR